MSGAGDRPGRREAEGTVRELLPRALVRVELDGRREVVAHAPRGPGRGFVRLVVGDRVRVELAARDPSRGRVTARLASGGR
jgi:translation initiation factor IF-1